MEKIKLQLIHLLQIVGEDKMAPVFNFSEIERNTNLRKDCQFDSLELAELGVRIEDQFGFDVFQDTSVKTFGDLIDRLQAHELSQRAMLKH